MTGGGDTRDRDLGFEGWRLVLPAGWSTVPTDDDGARAAINGILDRALEGKPRDQMIKARIKVDRALREEVLRARRRGARHVHLLTTPVRGVPVSGSLITVPVPISGSIDDLGSVLTAVLGESDGVVEVGHAELGRLPGLYRVRRSEEDLGDPEGPPVTATYVDYVVPIADDAVMEMVFMTMTEPIVDQMVALFHAIASTLHRASGDRAAGDRAAGDQAAGDQASTAVGAP